MTSTSPGSARYWAAGVVVALGLLAAIGILLDVKDHAGIVDARDARQAAGQALLPVAEAIGEQLDEAAQRSAPDTRDVGLTGADAPSSTAAARARDTAQPVLDNVQGGVIVVARYAADRRPPTSRAGAQASSATH